MELIATIKIFWKLSYPSILSPSVSQTNSFVFKFFNNFICFNNNLGYCSSVGLIPLGVGNFLSSFFNKGIALYIFIDVNINNSSLPLLIYLSKFPPAATNKGLSAKYFIWKK